MHLPYIPLLSLALSSAAAPTSSNATTINTIPAPQQQAPSVAGNAELVVKLLTAPTADERFKLLSKDSDFVYDFANPNGENVTTAGAGGHTVKADRLAFPALTGTGVAMTVGFLGPCGYVHRHSSKLISVRLLG